MSHPPKFLGDKVCSNPRSSWRAACLECELVWSYFEDAQTPVAQPTRTPAEALAEQARQIGELLRSGITPSDVVFDQLYSPDVRERSTWFWTPVAVAARAAGLLAPGSSMSVLDVGAGPGKLCCVGALLTNASWHGVERDRELVATAYATAISLSVDHRASFAAGEALDLDWRGFESIYLFNPYEARRWSGDIEGCGENRRTFRSEIERTEQRMAEAKAGTRIVTYHGFGGAVPDSYAHVSCESVGTHMLELWIKRAASRPSASTMLP